MIDRVKVQVEVLDEDEFAPTWSQERLEFSVPEGKLIEKIAELRAEDKDQSGKICNYEIETQNQPFHISKDGKKFTGVRNSWD